MRSDKTSNAQRPPLSGNDSEQETATILEARWPFYQEMADCTIDTSGKDIEAIVDEIVGAPGLRLSEHER
jgi:shikimate kinase